MVQSPQQDAPAYIRKPAFYDRWMESQGIPIYRDYYIEDGRTLELGFWEERGHPAAFLQLAGQEGVTESRITEIPPGGSIKPYKFSLEEVVYVLQGRGVTTVWADGGTKRSFEWQDHALFRIPGNHWVEYASMAGDAPVRLLHYNSLPVAMSTVQDPSFFFDSAHRTAADAVGGSGDGDGFYADAKVVEQDPRLAGREITGTATSSPTCGCGTSWCPSGAAVRAGRRCSCSSRALSSRRTCRCSLPRRTRRGTATGRRSSS